MDKREAKKLACWYASLLIESTLSNGWETLDRHGTDRGKVVSALNEIRAELDRRSQASASDRAAP